MLPPKSLLIWFRKDFSRISVRLFSKVRVFRLRKSEKKRNSFRGDPMNLERTPRNGELKSFGYRQMGYFMESDHA